MICHIEASANFDEEPTVVTAVCGAQCLIFEDGEPIPPDFDFVLPRDAAKADCWPCLQGEAERAKREEMADAE